MNFTLAINLADFKDPGRKRRQDFCINSIREVGAKNPGVHPVNICFPEENVTPEGWLADPGLTRSSREVTGAEGPRFPMAKDLFDRAAQIAKRNGDPYFLVMNSDILLSDTLIPHLAPYVQDGYDNMIVSRTEISDPADPPQRPDLYIIGQDIWISRTDWWLKNRDLFFNYIFPVRGFDVTYTTLMLCHSKAVLINTVGGLCAHIRHPQGCGIPAYNDYNFSGEHGADRIYLQRYNHYQFILQMFIQKHGRMVTAEENRRIMDAIFIPPSPEEVAFRDSLATSFATGNRHSYLQIVL